MLCNSVTFKFWATLELFRRHGNHKPKRFGFGIEHKSNDRAIQFHYQWLEIFGLLEETDIESGVAFLKSLSIVLLEFSLYNIRYKLKLNSSIAKAELI